MQYENPYGTTGTNVPYVDGNPASGIEGSIIPALAVQNPMTEIVNTISSAGITPIDSDLFQLAKAIQSGALNWAGTFGGSANNVTASLTPALTTLLPNTLVCGIVATTNTGATTLSVNGLSGPVYRSDAVAASGGELVAGGFGCFRWDGAKWVIVSELPAASVHYGVDTGTADNLVVTTVPAITAYADGQLFEITPAHTNATTTPQVTICGLGNKGLCLPASGALLPGQIKGGAKLLGAYDSTLGKIVVFNPQPPPVTSGLFTSTNSTTQTAGNSVMTAYAIASGSASFGSASSGTFTFTRGGIYSITLQINFSVGLSSAGNFNFQSQILQDGQIVAQNVLGDFGTGAPTGFVFSQAVIAAVSGDTVTIAGAAGASNFTSGGILSATLTIIPLS